jgi:c-di-GMP-binding flagellar brake protein YcgR
MTYRTPERLELSSLPISAQDLGGLITMEFEGLQGRFQSRIEEITPEGDLVLQIPPGVITRHPLRAGDTVTARYAHQGTIYGFRTRVKSHALQPRPTMVLARPVTIGTLRLRRDDRVPCLIPTTARVGERSLAGMIVDLSRNGCRFAFEPAPGEVPALADGEEVELRFPLFHLDERKTLSGAVRSLTTEDGAVRAGVEFGVLAPEVVADLEAYIAGVLDFFEAEAA